MRQLAIVLTALLVLVATGSARAATFAVDSTADAVDAAPGNGVCATATGVCTLRAAIQEANALAGADTINLPTGTYTLSIAGTGENAAATGDLDITSALTLNGAGAGSTIINGNGIDRVFHILVGATLTLSDVTIRGGTLAGADGGGILNEANLTLNRVTLTNNAARHGGAIYSQGASNSVTLSNVVLSSNTASGDGGAVGMKDTGATLAFTDVTMTGNTAVARGGAYFGDRASGSMTRVTVSGNGSQDGGGLAMTDAAANVTLTDVTVSSNTASRRGGGILADGASTTLNRVTVDANSCTAERGGGVHVRGGGTANLTNVTLSGNTCDIGGGLHIEGGGSATLTNVTVAGNGAPSGGGGLSRTGGALTIRNTIVANSTAGGNCAGAITSAGNNLESANTCALTGPGDLINSNPLLGALQFNGGPTRTHALLTGSPAINAGTNVGCPATDQRGVARPVAGICDIGAYEGSAASTVISGAVFEDVNGDAGLGDAVGAGNVRVRLYEDVNNNGVVDSGDLFSASTFTAAITGAYSFSVSTGTNFLVAVDSKTVAPSAGFNAGFGQASVWAEQTYGDDPTTPVLDLGPRIGGRSATTPDNFDPVLTLPANNQYEHLARVDVSGGSVTGINFAFSFNVISNTLDGPDVDTLNPRTRQGTLRQLVQNANAIQGSTTTVVPAGTYTLSIVGTGENAAATGDLDITDALTLNGAGVGSTIVDGNTIDRLFHVLAGTTATLSNMTIRNGDAKGGDGGGIWSQSRLALNNVTLTNNLGRDGGAIHVRDVPTGMSLTDVTMNNNNASIDGGALYSDNVPIVMTRVTASSNTAAGVGGAIFATDIVGLGTSISLTDVIMNNNRALNGEGGAFFGNKVAATMSRVTANSNTTSRSGGAILLRDSGGSSISLTDVTMTGNTAVDLGGAFVGDKLVGASTMTRVTVSGNVANAGGGLYFTDGNTNLTLTDVAVSGNTAANNGGGVFVDGAGTMTFNRMTVDGNTCTSNRGGGLHFKGGNTSSLTNVTVSGNSCSQGGGIHVEGGGVTLTNATVASNGATTGGGLNRTGGTLTIKNTIIANSTSGGNCSGTITSTGNNLESANTCGLTGPTNLINTNPLLGLLLDNGGFTRTHALTAGSPAIDAATTVGAPATDQRGVARGFDGNGVPNNPVAGDYDIGAYEAGVSFPATVTKVVAVISDPFNGVTNPKFIPGAIAEYTLAISNPGAAMDNNSMRVTDPLNPNTALFVNDIGGAGSGPVAFQQGTPASGLTYTFGGLASAGDDLEFSNNGGVTWTYTPTAGANGCDPAVTHVRVNPKGVFASGLAGADPNFQLRLRVCVK